MTGQKPRYCERVLRMCPHAPRQGTQAAKHEPAVKRGRDSAAFALNVSNCAKKFTLFPRDRDSTQNVAMAADILCGRVHNNIDTKVERPLQRWCPGIAPNANRAMW